VFGSTSTAAPAAMPLSLRARLTVTGCDDALKEIIT